MMKNICRNFLLVAVIFLTVTRMSSGQSEPGGLFVSGKITTEQGNVDGTVIKMTRNGKGMKDYNVLPDGKFNLRFEFNNDYTLVFTRQNNFPQKIVISTTVPADVLRRDRRFPPFPLDINLFTEIKGIDRTFSENAILRIYYSASVDNFIPEVYYNNSQIKKMIEQAIWQSRNVDKESDLLKRMSAAELAELKKEYNALLKKAGNEFEKQAYFDALDDYKSASRIFPDEQFPKDRIAEINDLIAVMGLEEEQARMTAEKEVSEKARIEAEKDQVNLRYKALVNEGDLLIEQGKLIEAVGKFRAALEVKPQETYPLQRIEEIRGIIVRQNAEKKAYDAALAKGDQAFIKQQYPEARSAFQEALQIRPAEKYPAEMVARIDSVETEVARKAAEKLAAEEAEKARLTKEAEERRLAAEAEKARLTKEAEERRLAAEAEKARIAAEQKAADEARRLEDEATKTRLAQEAEERRLSAQAEKARLEKEAEEKRLADEAEKGRLAKEAEEKRLADEAEKVRLAKETEENRLAAEAEKARIAAEEKAAEETRRLEAEATKTRLAKETEERRLADEAEKARQVKEAEEARLKVVSANTRAVVNDAPSESASVQQAKTLSTEAEELYTGMITTADQAYAGKEYNISRAWYHKALDIKPGSTYPQERVVEITRIIGSMQLSELDREFQQYIDKGDESFRNDQPGVARAWYNRALGIKPDDKYAKSQLVEIQIKIDEKLQGNADKVFNDYLEQGNKALDQKQYNIAKVWYQRALQLKPGDSRVKAKLDAVNGAISGK